MILMAGRWVGTVVRAYCEALQAAFTDAMQLRRLVRFGLDQNLDELSAPGRLGDIVFTLVEWAEAQGIGERLLDAALRENPGSPELRRFDQEHRDAIRPGAEAPPPRERPRETFYWSLDRATQRAALSEVIADRSPVRVVMIGGERGQGHRFLSEDLAAQLGCEVRSVSWPPRAEGPENRLCVLLRAVLARVGAPELTEDETPDSSAGSPFSGPPSGAWGLFLKVVRRGIASGRGRRILLRHVVEELGPDDEAVLRVLLTHVWGALPAEAGDDVFTLVFEWHWADTGRLADIARDALGGRVPVWSLAPLDAVDPASVATWMHRWRSFVSGAGSTPSAPSAETLDASRRECELAEGTYERLIESLEPEWSRP